MNATARPESAPIDAARLSLLLNELRLPAIKTLWPQFAETAVGLSAISRKASSCPERHWNPLLSKPYR